MHQGLEDVPALFLGGGDDGTHSGEVVGTPLGAEATGDLLAQLGHLEVTFGLIVRKRRARVGEESPASLLVLAEAERVMTMRRFFRPRLPVRSGGCASWKAMAWCAGPGPLRATREAGTSRPFSREKRGCVRAQGGGACSSLPSRCDQGRVRAGDGRLAHALGGVIVAFEARHRRVPRRAGRSGMGCTHWSQRVRAAIRRPVSSMRPGPL